MKPETLHSLITVRILRDEAKELIDSNDRHMCSAGLILLQDALEITFLALLIEKGIDDQKSLDRKSFDELIGELKKAGLEVPKTGTLKALNKQRVIVKHYGQLAEPVTVNTYADAADATHTIQEDWQYMILERVTGFNPEEEYYGLIGTKHGSDEYAGGYLFIDEDVPNRCSSTHA